MGSELDRAKSRQKPAQHALVQFRNHRDAVQRGIEFRETRQFPARKYPGLLMDQHYLAILVL